VLRRWHRRRLAGRHATRKIANEKEDRFCCACERIATTSNRSTAQERQ
jgi:hypothetical protein